MNMDLEALVTRFIENRDAVRAAAPGENKAIYPVCSLIYLAADKPVEKASLDQCKTMLRKTSGVNSKFSGTVRLPICCMLATGDEPEARWERTRQCYALLKKPFSESEYLALGSLLLSDAVPEEELPDAVTRARDIFKRMNKKHPILTGNEDVVLALLLEQTSRPAEELVDDMEACYTLLDQRFSKGDGMQSASHVLALSPDAPEEKAHRVIALYEAIRSAGGKVGKDRELPLLAALTLGKDSVDELVQGVLELDGLLAKQKGYKGITGVDRRTRIMHAVMLLTLANARPVLTNATASQVAMSMIAAHKAMVSLILTCGPSVLSALGTLASEASAGSTGSMDSASGTDAASSTDTTGTIDTAGSTEE